jgi:hypothetical protein
MEAVAYGQQAYRFNSEMRVGEIYLLRGIGFNTADMPPPFRLAIPNDYYVVIHSRTQVHIAGPNITIPKLPSRFMDFDIIARLGNKMLTGVFHSFLQFHVIHLLYMYSSKLLYNLDVLGIVVHVSPVRFHKSFDRSTPCRDVMLMNIK